MYFDKEPISRMDLYRDLDDAATYIGKTLRIYGRMNVSQYKTKWDSVRVYCSLGFSQAIHDIFWPGHHYCRMPEWLWNLDIVYGVYIARALNVVVIPYHKWLYRRVYKNAVKKWPHIKERIVNFADYEELLRGI